jgi:AcrR family transcriptional regulator
MPEKNSVEQQRRRRMRSSVTADEILRAAEHVARDGFDALTMRAVAARMGASPMAIYRYFATKDELVDAMLDRVLGRIELPEPTEDWVADLIAFAVAHRNVLSHHAWAIVPLFTHSSPGVNATMIGETSLDILARGGITGRESVAAFSAILALNYGWFAFSAARDATRGTVEPEAALADALAALPADRFPRTLSVAGELSHYGSSEHYALALNHLVAGITTTAEGASQRSPRSTPR